ncbi:MAG: hypothetical protein JXR97_02435 [Planctomycetes bacterium]|nr:hypothetical protein [Planctomycetota bacterium]
MNEDMQDKQSPSDERPASPFRHNNPDKSGPGGIGCAIIVLIVILAIIGGPGLFSHDWGDDPLKVLPLDTVLYAETSDLNQLDKLGLDIPLWREEKKADALYALRDRLESGVKHWTGELDDTPFAEAIKTTSRAAFTLIEIGDSASGTTDASGIIFLEQPRRNLAEELASGYAEKQDKALPQIVRNQDKDKREHVPGTPYVFAIGRWLCITDSPEIHDFVTDGFRKSKTLSESAFIRSADRNAAALVFADPVRYRKYRPKSIMQSLPLPGRDESLSSFMKDNSRMLVALQDKGERMEFSVSFNSDAGESQGGGGILSWILYIIASIVGLIIAGIAGIILIVIMIAVYFYIRQWISGDITPMTPPAEADLSDSLKEDLAINPVEFIKKDDGKNSSPDNDKGDEE